MNKTTLKLNKETNIHTRNRAVIDALLLHGIRFENDKTSSRKGITLVKEDNDDIVIRLGINQNPWDIVASQTMALAWLNIYGIETFEEKEREHYESEKKNDPHAKLELTLVPQDFINDTELLKEFTRLIMVTSSYTNSLLKYKTSEITTITNDINHSVPEEILESFKKSVEENPITAQARVKLSRTMNDMFVHGLSLMD